MGEDRLYFEDVEVGDSAAKFTHVLTRTDLVRYAGASGDYNPMHHDEIAAKQAGQPSVFGHGMFSMGLLATALTSYVGAENLASYKVRFAKQTWPGERLTTRIVVTGKQSEGSRNVVDLECSLENADGEVKVIGQARAFLASRARSQHRVEPDTVTGPENSIGLPA